MGNQRGTHVSFLKAYSSCSLSTLHPHNKKQNSVCGHFLQIIGEKTKEGNRETESKY